MAGYTGPGRTQADDLAAAAGVAPWLIDVDVFPTATNTGWNDFLVDTAAAYNAKKQNTAGAQNDEISWLVALTAGSWTLELTHIKNANRGQYAVTIDGVAATGSPIEGYSASAAYNTRDTVTFTVATSKVVRLKLKMATKNASSSQYFGSIQHIQLRRTA